MSWPRPHLSLLKSTRGDPPGGCKLPSLLPFKCNFLTSIFSRQTNRKSILKTLDIYIYIYTHTIPTLEPNGYSPLVAQIPRLTYLSAAEICLRTSITNPTAKSATSSEKRLGALATAMPRRRHSVKSTWSRPALDVTMTPRDGSCRRISAVMLGPLAEDKRARAEPPWEVKNWWRGRSE